MNNYPFNRNIVHEKSSLENRLSVSGFFNSKSVLSITGQYIVAKFNVSEKEGLDPFFDFDSANPHVFDESYLIRHQVEQLSRWALYYLIEDHKRTYQQIMNAAQIIRDEIWRVWDYVDPDEIDDINQPCTKSDTYNFFEEDRSSHYFTGSEAEKIGPKSYQTWIVYSEPCLELAPDDWGHQDIWGGGEPWTWGEIYAVQTLWEVDEAIVYVNLGKPYKAAVWLSRAYENFGFAKTYGSDSIEDFRSRLASSGGQARRDKYKPLKEFVMEKVSSKNYPSRRNAAQSIKPAVLEKAKELGMALSDSQAEITITGWLKEMGLPANI